MNILVTGGTGFIGKHIVKQLEKEHEVHCFSRGNGLDLQKNDISVLGDFNFDIMIHGAAHVGSVKYVFEHGADVIEKNLMININAYKSALKVSAKKVICLNAACIYPGEADVQHERILWNGEVHNSSAAFSSTKRALIQLGRAYKNQYGLESTNIIFPGVYGPGDAQDPEKVHALNALIIKGVRNKLFGENIKVWGTGKPLREWLYVKDISRLINLILHHDDLPDILNIGKEFGNSITDIVNIIQRKLEISDNEIEYLTDMPDGDPKKILGGDLFKSYFPKFKFTSLDEGIDETINYYIEILK